MPLTSASGSHTHTVSGAAQASINHETGVVYVHGTPYEAARIGVRAVQDNHRASLSLLGVTFDSYRVEVAGVPNWCAIQFISHDYDARNQDFWNALPSIDEDEPAVVDTPRALADYVSSQCNEEEVSVVDVQTFRSVAEEHMALQQRRVAEQMKHYDMNSQSVYQQAVMQEEYARRQAGLSKSKIFTDRYAMKQTNQQLAQDKQGWLRRIWDDNKW